MVLLHHNDVGYMWALLSYDIHFFYHITELETPAKNEASILIAYTTDIHDMIGKSLSTPIIVIMILS